MGMMELEVLSLLLFLLYNLFFFSLMHECRYISMYFMCVLSGERGVVGGRRSYSLCTFLTIQGREFLYVKVPGEPRMCLFLYCN